MCSSDLSNIAPRIISVKTGGYITAGLGVAIFPWKLLASAGNYLFVWLIGYSALLGPIAGILVVDYFFIHRTQLAVEALFQRNGPYRFTGGFHIPALVALAMGVAPNLPGFLHAAGVVDSVPAIFDTLYTYAWFVGVLVAGGVYAALTAGRRASA